LEVLSTLNILYEFVSFIFSDYYFLQKLCQQSLSRLQEVDFVSCYFSISFLFSFGFIFPFLEQLGLGSEVIGHTVTSVTI